MKFINWFKTSKYAAGFVVVCIVIIGVGVYSLASKSIFNDGQQAGASSTALGLGVPPFAGLYLLLPVGDSLNGNTNRDKADLQASQNPNISGIYLRTTWNTVEPTEGTYDWSYLDSQVAIAQAAHKKIEISIQAGNATPSWVYSDGAQKFNTITTENANNNYCQPAVIPVPWDPTYLSKWTGLINAFGAHYASNPNVLVIKLTGIDITTDETVAPQQIGNQVRSNDKGQGPEYCQTNNDVAEWLADGYTGQKMLNAWKTIVTTYAKAFPTQYLGIMTSVSSFPAISFGPTTTNPTAPGTPDPAGAELSINYFLPATKQILGNRFIVAQNGARPNHLDAGIWNFATSTGTYLGWQPSWPIDSCYNNSIKQFVTVQNFAAPCTMDTVIQQLITHELSSNPNYLEFQVVQINDMDAVVQNMLQQAATQVEHSGAQFPKP